MWLSYHRRSIFYLCSVLLFGKSSTTKFKCLITTELSKCGDVAVKCCLKKKILITKQTFLGHKILFLRIRMTICVKLNVDFLLSESKCYCTHDCLFNRFYTEYC